MKKVIVSLLVGFVLGSATVAGASDQVNAVLANVTLNVNGQDKTLENTPIIYNDRTYLPVREVSNMLGYDVNWDNNTSTVKLQYQNQDTDWIAINYLFDQYGVQMGVGAETTLSRGDVKITFATPKGDGIVSVATDKGKFQISTNHGRFYVLLSEMKALGLIQ